MGRNGLDHHLQTVEPVDEAKKRKRVKPALEPEDGFKGIFTKGVRPQPIECLRREDDEPIFPQSLHSLEESKPPRPLFPQSKPKGGGLLTRLLSIHGAQDEVAPGSVSPEEASTRAAFSSTDRLSLSRNLRSLS
jgi:hypothetical protein